MYGQGNYISQFGRGPSAPMPPPHQLQQQLPGPPPLPLHFQQGRPPPPPSVFQQGTPVYQHGHPVRPPATPSTSQPYLHPQPPVHGSTTLPPMYSTDQPNTHLGNQNVHNMATSGPPNLPRILPPPPPPPTTIYRAPVHQQLQQPGSIQHLQHMPLPPPPPPLTSSSFTSNPFGSFVHSTVRNSHMHSVAPLSPLPPPPPSDPPPIQPSPPPLTSPLSSLMHRQAASDLSHSNQPHGSGVSTSGCGDKHVMTAEVGLNVPQDDGSLNQEGSTIGENLLLGSNVMLDLPPPPPRPKEEKVVQKIEDVCQHIAKNGPGYEDLVQQNELGNPEFYFLFDGDSGSEAAIAHEYFLWVKKKCILACKLNMGKNDSPLRPSGADSSIKPNILEVASRTYSSADSDMEMEDDIAQSGDDPRVNYSDNGKTSGYILIHDNRYVKEQPQKEHTSESEKVTFAAQILVEQGGKVASNHEILAFEKPASKVYSPMINSADEQSATLLAVDKIPSGTTAAAQGLNSRKSSQLMKDGSPFRLIQDYVSDDISENDNNLHPGFVSSVKDSSSVAVEAASVDRNIGLNMSLKAKNFNEDPGREVKEMVIASITRRTTDEHVNVKCENRTSFSCAESPKDFQKKDPLANASIEGAKCTANSLKVDEFGRLVREGASGSETDDSSYNGVQGKRGRSRSRSPLGRRRRSPWRRKEKRSRSRGWSPRYRRSRSRSPRNWRSRSRSPRIRRSRSRSPRNRRSRSRSPRRRRTSRSPDSRRAGKFSGDGMRRERGQLPECFDFRRGRCYRGAACRYLHHESDKGNGLKHHTSKQPYVEIPPIAKNSYIHEESKHNLQKVSDQQHREIEILEMQIGQDMANSSFVASKEMRVYHKGEDSIHGASKAGSIDQDGRLINYHAVKSGRYVEAAAEILPQEERKVLTALTNKSCQEAVESSCPMLVGAFPSYTVHDADTVKSHGDASQDRLPLENPVTKPSHSVLSDPLLQNADLPQQSNNSSVSDSSPEQISMTLVNKLPSAEALPNMTDFRHHPWQLPSPLHALSQGVVAQNMTQPPGDYLAPQSASQSVSGERFPSYMLPDQQSHFSLSPMASGAPLAPPPPGVSLHLQQSHLPPRNEFGSKIRPFATQLPLQVGDFRERACPPTQEPNQSISHPENFRLKPLQPYNLPGQQFVGPGVLREDHLTHLPTLGVSTSSSFSQGDNPHLRAPFSQELSASKMHTFSGDNLPQGELLKSSSKTHPHLLQQQPPYSLHHPTSVSSSPRYLPELQEANHSSHPPDFRGSINSAFYNPYASTFQQPVSYKFSSDVVSVGSRQATSSPNSAKAVGQNFPRSGGDQYDPLLDSIEPSSNLTKKINNVQKWEPSSDSDIMLRHSGSNKPLDVEENNKKKEVRGVALATAVDNEECGETADAEVGAVENGSPSNPIGAADMNEGEIEIDQIKSPGKSKKNKESRSMKLFKVALADFVKEVLKPSWRQGNMSKEAFKTIVKKTVDKVCGAMKSHQIPKSRAKIDQYIVSSQRKLTKLVTGYVDKYVKM